MQAVRSMLVQLGLVLAYVALGCAAHLVLVSSFCKLNMFLLLPLLLCCCVCSLTLRRMRAGCRAHAGPRTAEAS
jgi:hypothetical protein